ncbi:MAG: hypothetical protein WBG92_05315, partial [Thiohalocapsa sp.]
MNGISGWFGTLVDPETAGALIDGMLAGSEGARVSIADLSAGVTGGHDLAHTDDEIVVVISDRTPLGNAAAVAAGYRRDGESVLQALHGPFALALL